jgi:uncharacterized membrane protein
MKTDIYKKMKKEKSVRKIRQLLIKLRSSLWFIPGIMIIGSIILAFFLIDIDSNIKEEWLVKYPRIFGLGSDGSRGMLTAIAGSMLTVAALAFSLTLSIIAHASGQYTPRILRNFMRDKINQFILGYFVSVYAYCLIILRTIRGADEMQFVPSLGVVVGLILAIGGIVVLIYFIHHIASSLQVTNIITKIEAETSEVVEKIFPERMGDEAEEEQIIKADKMKKLVDWYGVKSLQSGYIQYVDTDSLIEFAADNNLLLSMEHSIGEFVTEGTAIICATKNLDEDSISTINNFFNIFPFRTIEQDVGYGIRQIVDIALKSLSPGINDTTTAINCLDYLAVIVGKIAERKLPTLVRIKDGEIRVYSKSPSFQEYVEVAFDQIRINGKANLAIFLRLLKALSIVGEKTQSTERKEIVKEQIMLTKNFAEETLQTKYEKKLLEKVASMELKKIRQKIFNNKEGFLKESGSS